MRCKKPSTSVARWSKPHPTFTQSGCISNAVWPASAATGVFSNRLERDELRSWQMREVKEIHDPYPPFQPRRWPARSSPIQTWQSCRKAWLDVGYSLGSDFLPPALAQLVTFAVRLEDMDVVRQPVRPAKCELSILTLRDFPNPKLSSKFNRNEFHEGFGCIQSTQYLKGISFRIQHQKLISLT